MRERLDGLQGAHAPYEPPTLDISRWSDEVRTDVIVESDGSEWTGWYSIGDDEEA